MRVSRWGESLAVRLPKALVDDLQLVPGDDLEIVDAAKDRISVRRADRRAEALARMAGRRWIVPADYRFDREEANER